MEKEISAKLNHLRIAPRKVRLVADLVRGKNALECLVFLNHTSQKSAGPIAKLLKSAVANAKNNFQIDDKNLRIVKITVDEGPKLKRWRSRSMGRAYAIQKKTSHITLVLKEQEKPKHKIKNKKQEAKRAKEIATPEIKNKEQKDKKEKIAQKKQIKKIKK
ncbi:50S ribosomal protein L22 [Patescibacteria group bacterium]|nr:50S ribosomal protein L22 [Patescibacteria group bacterium]MBU4162462.1 50S ribosomal protein L22 [Patescibacteria group bacterium]